MSKYFATLVARGLIRKATVHCPVVHVPAEPCSDWEIIFFCFVVVCPVIHRMHLVSPLSVFSWKACCGRLAASPQRLLYRRQSFFEAVKKVSSGSKSLSKKYDKAAVMACLDSGGPQVLDDALLYLSKTGKVNTAYAKFEAFHWPLKRIGYTWSNLSWKG